MIEHPVPAMQMDARSPIGASSKLDDISILEATRSPRRGRRWVEAVLLKSDLSLAGRAKALVVAGAFALSHGDYARSQRYFEEGLELARRVGDKFLVG
jgi:hypothetical protein